MSHIHVHHHYQGILQSLELKYDQAITLEGGHTWG